MLFSFETPFAMPAPIAVDPNVGQVAVELQKGEPSPPPPPPTVEQVAKPSKEELRLIALIRARKTRNGRERCSLVRAGLPCQCLAGRAADAAAPQVSAQAA